MVVYIRLIFLGILELEDGLTQDCAHLHEVRDVEVPTLIPAGQRSKVNTGKVINVGIQCKKGHKICLPCRNGHKNVDT